MYRRAPNLASHRLNLTYVDPDAHSDSQSSCGSQYRASAIDGIRGSVERRKDLIPRLVNLVPAEPIKLATDQPVMRCEKLSPVLVSELRGKTGGPEDVSEHQRDH